MPNAYKEYDNRKIYKLHPHRIEPNKTAIKQVDDGLLHQLS